MNKHFHITIDGPSGAGKSTIAKLLAARLGIPYLDTGAMYRALALKSEMMGFDGDFRDNSRIEALLHSTLLDIVLDNSSQIVLLDGKNVNSEIRQHHISKLASDISALPAVRVAMANMQREMAKRSDFVLDGRDTGTYVLPTARYKFFLTADPLERAKRRHAELAARGDLRTLEQVLDDVNRRDYNDINRQLAPLKKAEDALVIDSTNLCIEQVLDIILQVVSK